MFNNLKAVIISWWEGELQEESLEDIFESLASIDKYKYHWTATVTRTIWFFWKKHWHILLPIFVGAAVALFIHFDSKTANESPQESQADKNTTVIHESPRK